MARKIPEGRFEDLVRVATDVFIAQGYRRTQMADVAAALGVAKGTLYGYVASKEALFDLCLRHANSRRPVVQPDTLPLPTPEPGALVRYVRGALKRERHPELVQALERRRAPDIRAEVEGVLRELYEVMERSHRGIELIDSCPDHPEIAPEWQAAGRGAARDRLVAYLESRVRAGQLRGFADVRLAARLVIETITTWAVHIKWDPFPQAFDPEAARDNAIDFLLRGLLGDGA